MPRRFLLLLALLALPMTAHYALAGGRESGIMDSGGGGAIIIDWVNDQRLQANATKIFQRISPNCRKFEGSGASEGVTFVPYTCHSNPHYVRDDIQRKIDLIRSDKKYLNNQINAAAAANPEIRYMKDRQDRLLREALDKWFAACKSSASYASSVSAQGARPQGGGCDPLGNGTKTSDTATTAKIKGVKLKQAVRKSVSDALADAQKKDWQLVHGIETRAVHVSGYGKEMQEQVKRLYETSGPFDDLLGGMDYEMCQDINVISQLQQNASTTSAAQANCKSMK